ncbi:MAG: ATP-binding protein [Calditrichaeota bacterium]|nr:MAG: ATP-binding protein [Calditrichota bacterium]
MRLIKRQIEGILNELRKQFPVITITGPRQSGKTTLVKKVFPDKPYFNLENPDLREFALADPRAFLKQTSGGAILDEIQRAPVLLSYLQEMVDQDPLPGKFILTGSNQFLMMRDITQTLAGRTVLLKLLPFSIGEIGSIIQNLSTDELMLKGFYPGIYKNNLNPTIAYRSYFETYIERDLRQLLQVKDLYLFQKFVRLCAGRIGQIFNASQLSNEIGVSVPTIKSWISILEASYVAYLLPPYYENIKKRLIKSPKLYFYDVGLAAYLLGIENPQQMSRDPLRGALFENMVIMDLLKARFHAGLDANAFFYRDSHQNEVDLVFKEGYYFRLAEVKSAQTFTPAFIKGIGSFRKVFPDRVVKACIVYDGEFEGEMNGVLILNFRNFVDAFLA